jgi:hypothetical protein
MNLRAKQNPQHTFLIKAVLSRLNQIKLQPYRRAGMVEVAVSSS